MTFERDLHRKKTIIALLSDFSEYIAHRNIIGITDLFKQLHRKVVFLLLNQAYRFFINSAGQSKIPVGFVLFPKTLINVPTQLNRQNFRHTTKLTNTKKNIAEYIPYFKTIIYLCTAVQLHKVIK